MALSRSLNRLELASVQRTVSEALERDGLTALSQRKLNALGLPLAYVDRDQRYRFANTAFLTWIAKRHEDVIGREVIEVVGRDVYALYNAYIDAALDGERTTFERQLAASGRPPIWIRVDYYPDRSLQGTIRGFLVTYADVDNLKHLELEAGRREHRLQLVTDSVDALKAQEVQLRLFADNIPGPIAYLDRSLRYTFVNQAFANWVCKPQDEIYGKSPTEVLKSDVSSFLRPILKRAQFGEHVEYERV